MTKVHIKFDDNTTLNDLDKALESLNNARSGGVSCPNDFVYREEFLNDCTELSNITRDIRSVERMIKSANFAFENTESFIKQNIKNISCFELQKNNNMIK